MKVKIIDPYSGWRYGFPKVIPEDVKDEIKWLIDNGYPKERIDDLGEYFTYRTYYKEDK